MLNDGAAAGSEGECFTFKAYPLTDDKDFSNFFHPQKDELLNLVREGGGEVGLVYEQHTQALLSLTQAYDSFMCAQVQTNGV